MPSNETAKTKSAPRRRIWVILLGVFVVVLGILLFAGLFKQRPGTSADYQDGRKYMLRVSNQAYQLTASVSEAAQEQGLSDTDTLPQGQGMLFVDKSASNRCFWMKDMKYSLDIIWLDQAKKIVHIEKSLPPSSYPKTYCAQAQYVIELNAGQANKNRLTTGQMLSF